MNDDHRLELALQLYEMTANPNLQHAAGQTVKHYPDHVLVLRLALRAFVLGERLEKGQPR